MRIKGMLCSILLLAGFAYAQGNERQPSPAATSRPKVARAPMPGEEMHMRTPMASPGLFYFKAPMGKWWKNSELMQKLGVTDAQVQKIEQIFQDYRLQLVDLHAALEKQEIAMEPLIESESPDEAKVATQIDRVASARGNLEKANALMFLAIRKVLSIEQWKKLQSQMNEPGEGPPPGWKMERKMERTPAPPHGPGDLL